MPSIFCRDYNGQDIFYKLDFDLYYVCYICENYCGMITMLLNYDGIVVNTCHKCFTNYKN